MRWKYSAARALWEYSPAGIAILFAVIVAVIWVQQAERRIHPVCEARRRQEDVCGQRHLPIKVNLAGVLPIFRNVDNDAAVHDRDAVLCEQGQLVREAVQGSPAELGIYRGIRALIIFFTFFYSVIQFNPVEIANNLKKNGGFIPGYRPGKATADYITKVLNRVTWFGGIFLALVTIAPIILGNITKTQGIWFGGTAILILVGVAIETVQAIEAQMLMRHYKGFLE